MEKINPKEAKQTTDVHNNIWQLVTPEEVGLKSYWWNTTSGAVQWTNPDLEPDARGQWEEVNPGGGSKAYWYNTETRETSWANPADAGADADVVCNLIGIFVHSPPLICSLCTTIVSFSHPD